MRQTKLYIIANGTVFTLLVLAHVLRVVAEGVQVLMNPWWVLVTAIAAALATWSWLMLKKISRH